MLVQKIIVVMLFVLPNLALASPKVSVDTQYYEIAGSSAKELRRELNAKRKMLPSGKKFDAYTRWRVRWQYRWTTHGPICKMKQVTTSVNITFMLPQWTNREDADDSLRRHWDRYYTALLKHEDGHKQTGVDAATEIQTELLKLQADSCQQLETNANALGHQIIKKYNLRDIEFDKNTNHGIKDGAVFP